MVHLIRMQGKLEPVDYGEIVKASEKGGFGCNIGVAIALNVEFYGSSQNLTMFGLLSTWKLIPKVNSNFVQRILSCTGECGPPSSSFVSSI